MESPILEPVDPEQRCPLGILGPIKVTVGPNHFGLVQSIHALTEGIVVGITGRPDRWGDACISKEPSSTRPRGTVPHDLSDE